MLNASLLLSISEASSFLKCHPNSLRLWEKRGLIKSIRFGVRGDRRYEKEELLRLIHIMKQPRQMKTTYEGRVEFHKLFSNIARMLKKGDFYWAFAFNTEYFDIQIRKILVETHARIAKKGIEDRAICVKSIATIVRKTYSKNLNIRVRETSKEIPNGVIILKDRVVFLLWGEQPSAFEVFESAVVKRYKRFFQQVWKATK